MNSNCMTIPSLTGIMPSVFHRDYLSQYDSPRGPFDYRDRWQTAKYPAVETLITARRAELRIFKTVKVKACFPEFIQDRHTETLELTVDARRYTSSDMYDLVGDSLVFEGDSYVIDRCRMDGPS